MKPGLKLSVAGFSLIELMIAITVLALGLALAMPSYSTWIQNTHIRNAAESIQHGMQRARAEAVTRNSNVAFTLGGGAFWTVTQVSDASVVESKSSGEISEKVTLAILPVPVPPALAPTTITFSNLGTVVANADGTPSIIQVDIDSTGLAAADSRELRMTIGVGGVVRMCDPNVASTTDPRYCP